jgi:putative membrane protein
VRNPLTVDQGKRRNFMTDYPVINGLIFCGLGIIVFIIAFSLVLKLAPLDLWKEIGEDRNIAAAILAGAVALGICWIIAATMH